MELRSWIEPLYTYGPYAVLVLFLSVALYLLKALRQVPAKNHIQQIGFGASAVACWFIVFFAVRYIYVNWPPTSVYRGVMGVYSPEPAKFISQSSYLYVRSTPTSDQRFRWDYVVIIRQPADVEEFDFTYQWGAERQQFRDYRLKLSELKQGRTKLAEDPQQPGELFYDSDDPGSPRRPLLNAFAANPTRPVADAAAFVSAAHAQERPALSALPKWLDSNDANVRSQARAQLRQLTPTELGQLLATPGLSEFARQQIETQQRTRR